MQSTHAELAALLKVIADETRLRILGLLAERPRTGKELAEDLQLTAPTVSHHMRRLTEAGVVVANPDAQRQWYSLNSSLLRGVRAQSGSGDGVESAPLPGDSDEDAKFRAMVIRNFFDGERLKEIPAQRKRRVVVLQHLVSRFAPGAQYSEREVNDLLRTAHEDVATLRRELVDYGYMQRNRGVYQLTRDGPGSEKRTTQIAQEITGNEQRWLQSLVLNVLETPESRNR